MRPRSDTLLLAAAVVAVLTLLPTTPAARAQRDSFDGAAARAQAKTAQERALDLNADGKVDDHEKELVFRNLLLQNAVNPRTGEIDQEKRKQLLADRRRLQAEAKARDKEEAVVEKLRERQARGRSLSEADVARIRAADEAAEARRRAQEREAREAAKTPRSAAGQRLSEPILNY